MWPTVKLENNGLDWNAAPSTEYSKSEPKGPITVTKLLLHKVCILTVGVVCEVTTICNVAVVAQIPVVGVKV